MGEKGEMENFCYPKNHDGLGIKQIILFNDTLLSK